MNFMIRTASVVSLVTFWLATIVWTVLIVAAPANAETGTANTEGGNSPTSSQAGSESGTTSSSHRALTGVLVLQARKAMAAGPNH